MTQSVAIAVVEDDDDLRSAVVQLLSLSGYVVTTFRDGAAALAAISADFPGVVLSDIRMPGMSGIELFRALHDRDPELPVILITGHGDIDMAVETMKAGAWDFLTKPYQPEALLHSMSRAAAARTLVIENRRLRALADASVDDRLIGQSAAMRRLRTTVLSVGETDLDVVVEGATGTGKHHLAKAIHRSSKRSRQRFVTFDCAAPPIAAGRDPLDAHGIIARAHRGTLFLDNLDRADMQLQHRLSQFVEQRAVALDARDPTPIDVRIIGAIDEGSRDQLLPALYHRLAAVALRIPPLSERIADVPLLIAHFAGVLARTHRRPIPALSEAAMLTARGDWPGNVRELELAVERLVLGLTDQVEEENITIPLPERLRIFERAAISEALTLTKGDVKSALKVLGIPKETFYYRVKRLGLRIDMLRELSNRQA